MALPLRALAVGEREGEAGERFEIRARDSVLLADSNRLESTFAHVVAHRLHVQVQPCRDIEDRQEIRGLCHGETRFCGGTGL